MPEVDVENVLSGMAEKNPEKPNWRTSIVDLMKLVGMDSSLTARKELAQEFLEYMVEAQTQKLVTDVTHYTPANPATSQLLTADERKSLHLDDPDEYMKRIYFWQDVPRRAKYNEIWNEVKSAP